MVLEHTRENLSTVTLFISFDLVNCTLYKSTHKGQWADSISDILKHIIQAFFKSNGINYHFWKVLGDEVVFTKAVTQMEEISQVLQDVYCILTALNHQIETAEIGDLQTAEIISAKATVWIADISPSDMCADNIYLEYQVNGQASRAEYLGTDIDSGFRVAQYTSSNRMVVTADLAALLFQEASLKPEFEKLNYVASRVLKGIWDEKPYPIFMYHGDETCTFAQSIQGITNEKMTVLQEYLDDAPTRCVDKPYHTYEEKLLQDFINNTNLGQEVAQLQAIILGETTLIPKNQYNIGGTTMYTPKPIDTTDVTLPEELLALTEQIAENVHEVWATGRISEGWTHGPEKDTAQKKTPCLVPYAQLPESEKAYDRNTAMETIKLMIKLGYTLEKKDAI